MGTGGSSTMVQFKEHLAAVLRSAPRVCFSEGLYTSSRQGSHASLRCASSVGVHMVKKKPVPLGLGTAVQVLLNDVVVEEEGKEASII